MGPAETSQTATSAAAPSFSPAEGSFTGPVNVSLSSATAGASIYYTQDGSTPSAASTLYTGAFTLSGSATVKALAVASGLANSSVAQADYVISGASAFRQALSPDGDIVMEAEHAHSQSELNPAYTGR
ncbi:MAG: chitobiase/beta-hexosaminidase C-terminal domain-containing protein [Hahellaceae bacterium]|nr:chitobiase/beta-hexosaminidase C-terminal domain-containing protein [Hahellaceae bacterium]